MNEPKDPGVNQHPHPDDKPVATERLLEDMSVQSLQMVQRAAEQSLEDIRNQGDPARVESLL